MVFSICSIDVFTTKKADTISQYKVAHFKGIW